MTEGLLYSSSYRDHRNKKIRSSTPAANRHVITTSLMDIVLLLK